MTPTPFKNALAAALYIVLIVLGISNLEFLAGEKETVLIPMTMLGLLTLSVALMGFLFFFEPVRLCLEKDRRQEGLAFFAKTVGIFAGFVVLSLCIMLFVSHP